MHTTDVLFRDKKLFALAQKLGETAKAAGHKLTTAESCTGGGVATAITMIPGSSAWFDRAFVTYSNKAKEEMLDVKSETLSRYGAVSEETARAMLEGAIKHSDADRGVAVTGIAGPKTDAYPSDKPIGTVWFAWGGGSYRHVKTACKQFTGDRHAVRYAAICFALECLIKIKL